MKVLIIGGSGQDAFYLATFLGTSHVSIVWLYRNSIDSYLPYLDSQKIVLAVSMIVGRLEILIVMALFLPLLWKS